MISVSATRDDKTSDFLKSVTNPNLFSKLQDYGQQGVHALSANTPVDTGLTADSWRYEVENKKGQHSIYWINDNTVNGVPVVILLQYGHGTRGGGWVQGEDFINPVIRPLFDQIADDVWKEVTSG